MRRRPLIFLTHHIAGDDAYPKPQVISRVPETPVRVKGLDQKEDVKAMLSMDKAGELVLEPALQWLFDKVESE